MSAYLRYSQKPIRAPFGGRFVEKSLLVHVAYPQECGVVRLAAAMGGGVGGGAGWAGRPSGAPGAPTAPGAPSCYSPVGVSVAPGASCPVAAADTSALPATSMRAPVARVAASWVFVFSSSVASGAS